MAFTFTYFNGAARGELCRLIFVAAGQQYTDNRIEFQDWGELKPKTLWKSLPFVEYDGKIIGQSLAAAEFLAKKLKLAGSDEMEQADSTQVVHALSDILEAGFKVIFEEDEEKKKKNVTSGAETAEKVLDGVEKILGSKDYIAGKQMTWADLALLNVALQSPNHQFGFSLDKRPKLQAVVKRVQESPKIAQYIKTRPVTQF